MVIYVDPETVKDVIGEGLYLPFVIMITIAVGYTVMMITQSWMLALTAAALLGLATTLSILRLLSWFTLLIIWLLLIFSFYLHKRDDSANESVRPRE